MRILKRILIVNILFLFLLSCANNRQKRKDIVAEKIEIINGKQKEWNVLSQKIIMDDYVKSHLGKFIRPENLENSISSELIEKGIIRISVTNDTICQNVEYATNWTEYPIGSLYIIWAPCDTVQTKKDYYYDSFDLNFIEVWGVGNNLTIYVDSDFI